MLKETFLILCLIRVKTKSEKDLMPGKSTAFWLLDLLYFEYSNNIL